MASSWPSKSIKSWEKDQIKNQQTMGYPIELEGQKLSTQSALAAKNGVPHRTMAPQADSGSQKRLGRCFGRLSSDSKIRHGSNLRPKMDPCWSKKYKDRCENRLIFDAFEHCFFVDVLMGVGKENERNLSPE